ncbi:MAG: NAD(P)-dependent oxidoreductase [Rhodomicrobium sp.]
MKIGICGMGKMGSAIAQRLLSTGQAITVWNRNPAKTAPLAELGAKVAATPSELAASCNFIITMLLNDAAVKSVYQGESGLLDADIPGKLMMDMSTVFPKTQEAIGAAVIAKGASYVECPVGGTVGPARDGKLLGLAGGSGADVDRAKPILDLLCRRVEHVGPIGAGSIMKLAVNLPLMVYWQALGESLALCRSLQLSPNRLIDILSDTSGTPTAMKGRGPAIAKLLAGEDIGDPAFDISTARKDLETMVAFGRETGGGLPLTLATLSCFTEAEKSGLGGADPINVPVFWASRSAKA